VRRAAAATGVTVTTVEGGITEHAGAAAAAALLGAGSPLATAVFAFNDRCALGFVDVMIRAGVPVPQQVSVVGYDDSPLAGLAHVDLTTVGQDSGRLAELAVARAIERIDTPGVPVDVVCEPKLVVRTSTAAPRN
jgi:DNA-binding LacI/PurR family transcriptional regulator